MSVFTLVSVSGSPGVTTTGLGLALSWPRPVVLVDADPSGVSAVLAGFLRGVTLPGLSELVLAHREHRLAVQLPSCLVALPDSQARLLSGVRSPRQSAVLAGVWDALLDALRALSAAEGVDVIVDAGRVGLRGSAEPLMAEADELLVLTGSGLPEVAAVHAWTPWLEQCAPRPRLVVVGEGRPYARAEVQASLGLPVAAVLPWDPRAARVWSHGESGERRRWRRDASSTGLAAAVAGLGRVLRERISDVDDPAAELTGRGAHS